MKKYQIFYRDVLLGRTDFETGDSPQAVALGEFCFCREFARAYEVSWLLGVVDENQVLTNDEDFLLVTFNEGFTVLGTEEVVIRGGMLTIPKTEDLDIQVEIMCDDREQFDRLFPHVNEQYASQFER